MSIVNGTESEDSAFRKAIEASIYAQAGVGSSDFSARSEGLPVVPVDQDCSVSSIVGKETKISLVFRHDTVNEKWRKFLHRHDPQL